MELELPLFLSRCGTAKAWETACFCETSSGIAQPRLTGGFLAMRGTGGSTSHEVNTLMPHGDRNTGTVLSAGPAQGH